MKKAFFFIIIPFLLCVPSLQGWSQASLETFGHNRVQKQKFAWQFYQTEHFKIYFNGRAGRTLARYVAEQAEKDLNSLQKNIGGILPEQLSLILYNSYDEFKQSNIGLNASLQLQNNNPAGTIHLVGDKLVIFFDGHHDNLKRQIRQGMVEVMMEHLIFGANFREMARNAIYLDVPKWVTEGYIDYIVDGWTSTDENNWKNLISEPKVYFNDLMDLNPRLAGKAFWKYISYQYGARSVNELLSLIQLKGSVNKATKIALNEKINVVFDSAISFYHHRFNLVEELLSPPDTINPFLRIPIKDFGSPDQTEIRNINVSPKGADVAYVKWQNGTYDVIIEKTKKLPSSYSQKGNKRKASEDRFILEGGITDYEQQSDPNYPILAWNNTGYKLGMIYEQAGYIKIRIYNSLKAKIEDYRIPKNRFDRVTGFSFMEDDEHLVLSAIKNGQSDLFYLQFRGYRVTQLTNDPWDDEAPVFVSGGSRKGLVFLSNRPEPYLDILPLPNELPTGEMNAYFYNFTTKSKDLLQLTHNEQERIKKVIPYGQDNFAYLSDKNGVFNRYLVLFARDIHNMDSAFSIPVTNYAYGIQDQNYNPASKKIADAVQYKNAYYLRFKPIEVPKLQDLSSLPRLPLIPFIDRVGSQQTVQQSSEEIKTKEDSPLFDGEKRHHSFSSPTKEPSVVSQSPEGNLYQREFTEVVSSNKTSPRSSEPTPSTPNQQKALDHFENLNLDTKILRSSSGIGNGKLSQLEGWEGNHIRFVDSIYLDLRPSKYYLSFRPDFLSARLDNNLLFNRYQAYSQNAGQYTNPALGGMLTARIYDKMEDYRFTGGLRLPANLSGTAYFLQFENFRRRLDWNVTLFREVNKQTYNFSVNGSSGQELIQVPGKTITNILQSGIVYPFNQINSLHLQLAIRQDQMILKSENIYGLALPDVQDWWSSARLEYISDNTRNTTMNIWKGMRYKLFAETFYKFYTDNDVYQLASDTSSFKTNSWVYNFGFDYRFYQPIYQQLTFAVRLSGAHSGGTQKIIQFLGGVANDLNAKFNNNYPPSGKNDYAFQALATDLRGYDQNARNGNTYLLSNFEFRLPVLTTFVHRPIQSTILKNLQAVAFLDVGNAWEGLLPDVDDGIRPLQFYWPTGTPTPTINLQIKNPADHGLAMGYGLGLRTMLWGYFIRADAAMNIRKKFHWYLSFGTDF